MGARQLQLLLSCCRIRVSFSKFDRIGQRRQRRCKPVYSPSGRVSCADPPRTRKSRPARRRAPHRPLTGTGLMCGRGVAFWSVEKRALQGGGGRFALVGVTGDVTPCPVRLRGSGRVAQLDAVRPGNLTTPPRWRSAQLPFICRQRCKI